MGTGPTASETKRNVLRVLLVEGSQSVKLVVDPEKLDTLSGFPDRVITGYDDGIPLDLNPAWPLELDLDDPISLGVSLSFGGQVCRCRVAWAASRRSPAKAIHAISKGVRIRIVGTLTAARPSRRPAASHSRCRRCSVARIVSSSVANSRGIANDTGSSSASKYRAGP